MRTMDLMHMDDRVNKIKKIADIIINESLPYSGDAKYYLKDVAKNRISKLFRSDKLNPEEFAQFIKENLSAFKLFGIDVKYNAMYKCTDILYSGKELVL